MHSWSFSHPAILSSAPREFRGGGKRGGLAAVFNDSFKFRVVPTGSYSSFELQLFAAEFVRPVLLSITLSEFLAEIYVCCPSEKLVTDFKSLLATFNLTQTVDKPMHLHGHTLDLVISLGLSVSLKEITKTAISDHFHIVFELATPPQPVSKPLSTSSQGCIFTSSMPDEFTAAEELQAFYLE